MAKVVLKTLLFFFILFNLCIISSCKKKKQVSTTTPNTTKYDSYNDYPKLETSEDVQHDSIQDEVVYNKDEDHINDMQEIDESSCDDTNTSHLQFPNNLLNKLELPSSFDSSFILRESQKVFYETFDLTFSKMDSITINAFIPSEYHNLTNDDISNCFFITLMKNYQELGNHSDILFDTDISDKVKDTLYFIGERGIYRVAKLFIRITILFGINKKGMSGNINDFYLDGIGYDWVYRVELDKPTEDTHGFIVWNIKPQKVSDAPGVDINNYNSLLGSDPKQEPNSYIITHSNTFTINGDTLTLLSFQPTYCWVHISLVTTKPPFKEVQQLLTGCY